MGNNEILVIFAFLWKLMWEDHVTSLIFAWKKYCFLHETHKKGCLMVLLEQLKIKRDITMGKATFVEILLLIFFFGKICAIMGKD